MLIEHATENEILDNISMPLSGELMKRAWGADALRLVAYAEHIARSLNVEDKRIKRPGSEWEPVRDTLLRRADSYADEAGRDRTRNPSWPRMTQEERDATKIRSKKALAIAKRLGLEFVCRSAGNGGYAAGVRQGGVVKWLCLTGLRPDFSCTH